MDTNAKGRIYALRTAGYSYVEIARLLDLPVGSVKSFCSRNEVKRRNDQTHLEKGVRCACQQCGAPVTQQPHRKLKLFCSDSCRMRWWNAQRSTQKRRKFRSQLHDTHTV